MSHAEEMFRRSIDPLDRAYWRGVIDCEAAKQERIIALLEDFQTQFGTGWDTWDTVYSESFASGIAECLALIKGENP